LGFFFAQIGLGFGKPRFSSQRSVVRILVKPARHLAVGKGKGFRKLALALE
jgi:hypothetical protein